MCQFVSPVYGGGGQKKWAEVEKEKKKGKIQLEEEDMLSNSNVSGGKLSPPTPPRTAKREKVYGQDRSHPFSPDVIEKIDVRCQLM